MLSDSESDGEAIQQLTINEHFAKVYASKKEREELSKLKDKYGSDVDEIDEEEDSTDYTDEDEDGEELTPAVDAAILRTLARIRRKDPEIYENGKAVFEEEEQRTNNTFTFFQKEKDKSKPLLLRQHILNSNLNPTSRSPSPTPLTHVAEQAALRKETISAFHTAVADPSDSDDEDGLLVPREKTKDELEHEQEEYRDFLAREVGEDISKLITIENADAGDEGGESSKNELTKEVENKKEEKKKKKRKEKSKKSKEEEDHEFLMDYILNRGWIDKSTRHVPTFDEITGSKSKKGTKSSRSENKGQNGGVEIIGGDSKEGSDEGGFDEDEFDDIAETFESSYNFRFEEPGAAAIPSYPRSIANTVRREENPRKAARERKKERKEEQIVQKREEVKRLKALKMKDLREKLERIGREGGMDADDEALTELDLDADWDPEAHDKQMAGVYGDDEAYDYGDEEEGDAEKPTWDDDIDITDIIPSQPQPEPSSSKLSKKEKKKEKKKLKKLLAKKGEGEDDEDADGVDIDAMDASNPQSKEELTEALSSLNDLEFNSLVGSGPSALPTRFKYVPVLPSAYGLSPLEIFMADDTDLNEVVGLKKLAPYRRDKGKAWDSKRNEKLREFRKNLGEKRPGYRGSNSHSHSTGAGAIDGEIPEEGGDGDGMRSNPKKRKGKKERQKEKLIANTQGESALGTQEADSNADANDGEPATKKRKRRHKNSSQD